MIKKRSYYFFISVRRSVRPSVCMYQRSYHWTEFREIWCWGHYKNMSRKSKFGQNWTKISGLFTKTCLGFIVSGYVKSPYKRYLRLKLYQAFRKLRKYKHYADVPNYSVILVASFVVQSGPKVGIQYRVCSL